MVNKIPANMNLSAEQQKQLAAHIERQIIEEMKAEAAGQNNASAVSNENSDTDSRAIPLALARIPTDEKTSSHSARAMRSMSQTDLFKKANASNENYAASTLKKAFRFGLFGVGGASLAVALPVYLFTKSILLFGLIGLPGFLATALAANIKVRGPQDSGSDMKSKNSMAKFEHIIDNQKIITEDPMIITDTLVEIKRDLRQIDDKRKLDYFLRTLKKGIEQVIEVIKLNTENKEDQDKVEIYREQVREIDDIERAMTR